jgi:hypothetical protein
MPPTDWTKDFFRVRFDRLTDREKDDMRAMAELGPGRMIYSEKHGRNGFTVPMFDDFMRRAMPEWTAPAPRPVRKTGN